MRRRALGRALKDERGVAAMEFALIFPAIFMLHIAAAEAFEIYNAQRAVAHLAAAMADITAQNRSVSQADLDDIIAAGSSMIYPYPTTSLQQRIASLSAGDSGGVSTDWQVRKSFSAPGAPSVPAGYLAANESAIVTTVIYDYKPTFGLFLPDTIRISHSAYSRPRLTTKVEKTS